MLTSSCDFTHHPEKKVLTVDRKNCLPSSEKSAYRGQKNLLTANGKNSLPNDGKIILPRADMFADNTYADACLARITDKKRAFRLEMNGKSMREPV